MRLANNLIVFRVDARPHMGLGHLRRCSTLAAELRVQGFSPLFICEAGGTSTVAMRNLYPHFSLDPDTSSDEGVDAAETLKVIERLSCPPSWVVVDHYALGARWEKAVRANRRLLAIDDYRNRRHHADVLVSDTAAPFDPAANDVACADALTGRAYALIDAGYSYSPSAPKRAALKSILVSYGGVDPTGETLKLIDAIRNSEAICSQLDDIKIVIGRDTSHAPAILRAASTLPRCIVLQDLPTLVDVMKNADLVLTAGGNTMTEALALRKPCLVTITATNQEQAVSELVAERVIQSLGHHSTVGPQRLAEAISNVRASYDVFANHVQRQAIFDHLGAARIVFLMKSLTGEPR